MGNLTYHDCVTYTIEKILRIWKLESTSLFHALFLLVQSESSDLATMVIKLKAEQMFSIFCVYEVNPHIFSQNLISNQLEENVKYFL